MPLVQGSLTSIAADMMHRAEFEAGHGDQFASIKPRRLEQSGKYSWVELNLNLKKSPNLIYSAHLVSCAHPKTSPS